MELLELYKAMLETFEATDSSELGQRLMDAVLTNDFQKYAAASAIFPDLSHDWLQKIFQYYLADRKGKKQDFTPPSLARFMARLMDDGHGSDVIDFCAGSGALAIQAWNINPDRHFVLYEMDADVIPFLLFNVAIRNMDAEVFRCDVLADSIFEAWIVARGDSFSSVTRVSHYENDKLDQQSSVQLTVDTPGTSARQLSLFAM